MKIKPAAKRGEVVIKLRSRDEQLLARGLQDAENQGWPFQLKHVLVPIDFSEHSKKTIQYAIQLATLTGASIRILHVFQISDYPAAFHHGLYLEHEAVKVHLEAAKRAADAQLSLVAEEIRAHGLEDRRPRTHLVPGAGLPQGSGVLHRPDGLEAAERRRQAGRSRHRRLGLGDL